MVPLYQGSVKCASSDTSLGYLKSHVGGCKSSSFQLVVEDDQVGRGQVILNLMFRNCWRIEKLVCIKTTVTASLVTDRFT